MQTRAASSQETEGHKVNRTDKGEPITENSWPQNLVKSVECRPRDLVLRITNWMSDKDEPAYDVEVYVGGVYDWNLSKCCTRFTGCHTPRRPPKDCLADAITFAQEAIARELPTIKARNTRGKRGAQ